MYYFFLISYTILGAGIKYIDEAFDEKIFNKKNALVLAPIFGVLWAFTMLINPVSATILLAVLCGVFFKGKIDNLAHLAGFIIIMALIVIGGVEIMIIPLIFLGISAFIDEVGNDIIDKYKSRLNDNNYLHNFLIKFFDHRWFMKTAILVMVIIGIIPILFFLAMVFFDYSYLAVRIYSKNKQRKIDSLKNIRSYKVCNAISSAIVIKSTTSDVSNES